jgi:hypothetical protein
MDEINSFLEKMEHKSLLLHNPNNMEYGYINEPTKLINIRLFKKSGRVGILADVEPLIRDNLNLNGKFYKRIILAPTGLFKEKAFRSLDDFPIKVQVIFIEDDSDIPDNWYENKYFKGTITKTTPFM